MSEIKPVRPQSAQSLSLESNSTSNDQLDQNLSSLCDNYLEQSYVQLKILCLEKVKKPGKDYSDILQLINESQLTIRMRLFLIRELTYEASRFKRQALIKVLAKFASLLTQIGERDTSVSTQPAAISPAKDEFSIN